MTASKRFPTLGCCGIDCGLCPRYYTEGASRCPGCAGPGFSEKHPSCSVVTCCLVKRHQETCAECGEFPCDKIRGWDRADSFVTHRNSMTNLVRVRERGMAPFMTEQRRRIKLLEELITDYDDGRSKSMYCLTAALLPIPELEGALREARRRKARAPRQTRREAAASLKEDFQGRAGKVGVDLVYRKA